MDKQLETIVEKIYLKLNESSHDNNELREIAIDSCDTYKNFRKDQYKYSSDNPCDLTDWRDEVNNYALEWNLYKEEELSNVDDRDIASDINEHLENRIDSFFYQTVEHLGVDESIVSNLWNNANADDIIGINEILDQVFSIT